MKKFINQKDMKQSNTADVFGLIRKNGRMTRRQIADKTEMSWGAVSTITARLIEEGYISEVKSDETSVGRTPYYLEVDGTHHFSLGVDVNCSGLRAVIMNLKNEVVDSFAARADMTDRDSLLSGICDIIERAMASERHFICIGIAMQGITDTENGISLSLSGCAGWSNVPIAYILERKFSLPVHIEHDPNCILYAIGEKARRDTALVRIDRGIGMAVMLDGKIIDKPGIFELGHVVVEPGGDQCSCGKRGCLELYASMDGIEKRTGLDFSTVAERARAGDGECKKYFDDMADRLAVSLVNITGLLCLESLVLCGDMCDHKDLFFRRFAEKQRLLGGESLSVSFSEALMAAKGAAMLGARAALKQINIEKTQSE